MRGEAVLELSLKGNEPLVEQVNGSVTFRSFEGGAFTFNELTPGLVQAFNQLATGGYTEQQLGTLVLESDGASSFIQFYGYMQALSDQSVLCHTVREGDRRLATIVPIARHYRFAERLVDPEQMYVLSRFVYCHREDRSWVVESPLGYAKIILHNEIASVILAVLAQPCRCEEIVEKVGDVSATLAHLFLNLLLNAKAIVVVNEDGRPIEDTDTALIQWDFHDLLFHARSRLGRHNNPYGGTFRFRGKCDPLPARKPLMSDKVIPLYRPSLEQCKQTDLSFTTILETRKSIRNYSEQPITAQQLGEFLYRAARVKQILNSDALEFSLRPYPAGGAIYELEIYPVIDKCTGIAPGLYHYDPFEHQLHKVVDKNEYVETLLHITWVMANRQARPQVYLGITARFQRVQWKYESIVYALILKHVGVLYQTMYLVATAMELAPCALGGGNTDLFATATGLNYYEESLVGEFVLGSKGDDEGRATS